MSAMVLDRTEGEGGTAPGAPSMMGQFRLFHAELLGIRDALALGDRLVGEGQARPDPAELAARINRRLHRLLDGQAAQALRAGGGYAAQQYREAQYLMVALADETLLHGEGWNGREEWLNNLLELSLFGTRIAGEKVFQNLDALLASRTPDPELIALYLAVLSLGFRGRYWRQQDNPQLRRYRQTLAERLKERRREEVRPGETPPPPRLCPAAYAATLSRSHKVRLPHLRPYALGFVVLFFLYSLVAHGVWFQRTERLDALTAPIQPTAAIPAPLPTGGAP